MTLRLLATEVYNCVNNFNPEYLNEVLTMKNCPYDFRDTSNLKKDLDHIPQSKVLNPLEIMVPYNYNSAVSLLDLKNMIESWNGPRFKCSV